MNTIEPEILYRRLENNEKLTIIDVREAEEVAAGMIPGAIHIPMGEIPERHNEIDRSSEIILVCRSGVRSSKVYEYLESLGFTNLKNMTGGMLNW